MKKRVWIIGILVVAKVKTRHVQGDGQEHDQGEVQKQDVPGADGHRPPTADDHAVFPDTDTTVTVDGDVKAAIIRTEGNSSATISFIGQGSIEVTSDAFVQTSWTSANFDFNVDVKATPSNDRWISIYNNNTFR